MPAWTQAFLMQRYDSAFRVWRIFGGGKIRQTLKRPLPCKNPKIKKQALSLSKGFYLAAAAKKFLKGAIFASVESAPPVLHMVIATTSIAKWEAISTRQAGSRISRK